MLTLRQRQEKRLELIDELAELLIADAVDLPATTQRHLEGLSKAIASLRRHL